MRRGVARSLYGAVFLLILGFTPPLLAADFNNHKGAYLYFMGGFMKITNDTNQRSNLKFGSSLEPGYGLTFGYNITDWIAPELQIAYSTATGTTPSGNAREHVATVRLNAKYSFLTENSFNHSKAWRIYPYAKAGGVAHAVYVNAPSEDDKVGAYGGGFGIGGGLEADYKALYLGLDISNDFVFQQETRNNISGVDTLITKGGFDYQISVMGAVGVHF